jgi:trimeric autotransporter adhesin
MRTARRSHVVLALAGLLAAGLLAPSGAAAQVPTPPLPFVAIDPCRVVDTRGNGFGGPFGPPSLVAGVPRDFPLVGQCGVPPEAQAVSLNVTATNTLGVGFFLLHPAGGATPLVSTLNYLPGLTVANAALAPLGPGGLTVIAGVSGADLILDVNGYFVDAGVLAPLTFQGLWDPGTRYGVNDLVSFRGLTYVSRVDGNTGNPPDTSPAQWALFTGSFDAGGGSFQVATGGVTRAVVGAGGDLSLTGTLTLVPTSTATAGTVFKGASRFLHNAGADSTFLGVDAGNFAQSGVGGNTGVGARALQNNTTGGNNTAVGNAALLSNIDGTRNTAVGDGALFSNLQSDNTAVGQAALFANTTGNFNTAVGSSALASNTTGEDNTAIGPSAMFTNTTGNNNVAVGNIALRFNTIGNNNTALGLAALEKNTTGSGNTGAGQSALQDNTTGSNNVAIGFDAGTNATTGDNNIYIAHQGVAAEAATTRIGTAGTQVRAFVAGISGVNVGAQPAVLVNGSGQLGVNTSSARYKEAIEPMGEASQGLQRLRPVTFRYRQPLADGTKPRQYGLIAEEVAEVYPDLVAYGADGQPEAVLYHVLPALLLNELQALRRELGAKTELLEAQSRLLEALRRRMDALDGR